ncbi:NUDIX domain-containing protein [Nonomuraea guangzhouensis]|uniref:NUDIX domain-containing protein n=1 Tax=Nonomuraea guangzhouensis TaxID=1291555 RepID=A0ABW4GAS1_9ACTN|nr:NUDIX domain-containing protein [Nonomuraea guangzhouensis]
MTDPTAPFSRVKIRSGAVVFCGEDVALIRRDRPTGSHYTAPGGNVRPGEDIHEALHRELAEELQLDLDDATPPELCWIQDQMVVRPGPTPPPRKIHLIFRCHITPEVRQRLATVEYDNLPDGGHELGVIEWVNYRKTATLPLFPLIGPALTALPTPGSPTANAWLPPITDNNYIWK